MEIKVGEYIRTKIGTIGKIKRIDFDEIDKSLKWYIYDKKDYITGIVEEQSINKPNIISHSFNIIDLMAKHFYDLDVAARISHTPTIYNFKSVKHAKEWFYEKVEEQEQ